MENFEEEYNKITDRLDDLSECIDILAEGVEEIYSQLLEQTDLSYDMNKWLLELSDKLEILQNPEIKLMKKRFNYKYKKFKIK